jgi:hypothetical protein
MKATLDIPDDLYRRVKARSALEGRPLRAVAIGLFQQWLEGDDAPPTSMIPSPPVAQQPTRFDGAPWVSVSRSYLRSGMSHDMADMREAAAKARSKEATESLKRNELTP